MAHITVINKFGVLIDNYNCFGYIQWKLVISAVRIIYIYPWPIVNVTFQFFGVIEDGNIEIKRYHTAFKKTS